jgi:hypothetical protein
MADHLTLVMNLRRKAVSQYCDYNFNSMIKFNGAYLGASDDGIFEIFTGDGDGAEGDPIAAYFELPRSDFGMPNMKRFRKIYLGYKADGSLQVTVTDDNGTVTGPVTIAPYASDKQSHQTAPVSRSKQGAYWQMKVANVAGADFTIDSIEALINVLGRKPR